MNEQQTGREKMTDNIEEYKNCLDGLTKDMPEEFFKLAQIFELSVFEPIHMEGKKDIYAAYLMNDAVESFLVLKNARMTGNYVRDYEGEFEGSVEKADRDLCEAEYILVVHQGQNVFTVFFEDILLETQLYNYGELGHFWVKGYENLRVMEYQIAILRDKYEYLGEKYCTEYEGKLEMLRDFPPLNYLFYPAVPEKYIVPVDNPWEVTAEALAVMQELATEAGDEKLGKMLRRYEKNPDISNAKKIAGMLCRSSHLPVITLLGEKIREAASVYPDRDFGRKQNKYLHELM